MTLIATGSHACPSHLCRVLHVVALDHELFHTFSKLFSKTVLAFSDVSKSSLTFLFLKFMSGLHLAVKPLYLLSYVDLLQSVARCLAVVKGFFYIHGHS